MNREVDDHFDDDVDQSLMDDLARLFVKAERSVATRVFDEYVAVRGPAGSCWVGYGEDGIRYVTLIGDEESSPLEFVKAYSTRFGRPIRAGVEPLEGLEAALVAGQPGSLSIDLSSRSDFERSVLEKTAEIPKGEIRPYGWVAAEIGRPRAVRAVGTALAHNPVPFIIPCHRVVRSDGVIGNYAFGSEVKSALLRNEGIDLLAISAFAARGDRYLGNLATRLFCYPTCVVASQVAETNRIGFRSIESAVAGGFLPCKTCRPPIGG